MPTDFSCKLVTALILQILTRADKIIRYMHHSLMFYHLLHTLFWILTFRQLLFKLERGCACLCNVIKTKWTMLDKSFQICFRSWFRHFCKHLWILRFILCLMIPKLPYFLGKIKNIKIITGWITTICKLDISQWFIFLHLLYLWF